MKKRNVEPDSPQSAPASAARNLPVPVTHKALRPANLLGTSSITTPKARKQRQVASISLDMLILSTTLVPSAKPAQIISLCPILLEEGASTVPCNLVGMILIFSIIYPK